jgi:hypothetical protein
MNINIDICLVIKADAILPSLRHLGPRLL